MRPLLAATLALLLGASSACATKIYQGPTSGRAAEAQIAAAESADRAFAAFDARAFSGKRVVLQVYGLTERLDAPSPEEAYVRSLLSERLLAGGATLAPDAKDAQVLLAVTLRSLGVDVIRRDVPLIYNHHTFRGLTSAKVVAYRLEKQVATGILSSQQVEAEAIYREIYIFYAIGPITSRG
jgi:hypothetical protein